MQTQLSTKQAAKRLAQLTDEIIALRSMPAVQKFLENMDQSAHSIEAVDMLHNAALLCMCVAEEMVMEEEED